MEAAPISGHGTTACGPPAAGPREPWVVRAGGWLTRRRSVLLAPLFAVALLAARPAGRAWVEWWDDLAALACIGGGVWLRLVAASYHESSYGDSPITAGPYAWIRHPLYVANFLLGLGMVLLAGWWPMVVVYLAVFLPMHAIIMRSEEVHLAGLYGEGYAAYRWAVPGVMPWRRYRGPRLGSRSSYKLRKGQEWWKVAGYLAGGLGFLLLKASRPTVVLPVIPAPLSWISWAVGLLVVTMAVVMRPKTRSALLRASQTALVVASALFLASQIPGVLPPVPIPVVGATIAPPPDEVPPERLRGEVPPPAPAGAGGARRA